jgi:DNA polymerase eta
LAVSYSARKFGITRKDTVKEALKKCPELKAIHVPVIRDGKKPGYEANPDIKTCKSSLFMYRNASAEIMKIIKQNTLKFQKASVDEVFIDVTEEALGMESVQDLESTFVVDEHGSKPLHELQHPTEQDFLLLKAAKISSNLRAEIFTKLGYTCSTGISINKTLAKLVSSSNKPNKVNSLLITSKPFYSKMM